MVFDSGTAEFRGELTTRSSVLIFTDDNITPVYCTDGNKVNSPGWAKSPAEKWGFLFLTEDMVTAQ